jgi:hypothetical protein
METAVGESESPCEEEDFRNENDEWNVSVMTLRLDSSWTMNERVDCYADIWNHNKLDVECIFMYLDLSQWSGICLLMRNVGMFRNGRCGCIFDDEWQ